MHATVKKTLRWIGLVILALEVLLVMAVAGIETDTGKLWLAKTISSSTRDKASGTGMILEGISGNLPWDIRIAHIGFADTKGEYASISGFHLAWQPMALFKRYIQIHALEAAEVTVKRMPVVQPSEPAESKPFHLPHIPSLTLEKIAVGTILIDKDVTGSTQKLTLAGGGNAQVYELTLKTLEGPDTSLTVKANILAESVQSHIALTEAPGGILLHLLKQPADAGLIFAADTGTDRAGVVRLSNTALTLGRMKLTGGGDYALGSRYLNTTLDLEMPDLDQFSALADAKLEGQGTLHLSLAGPPDAVVAKLEANLRNVSANVNTIPQAHLAADGVVNQMKASSQFHLTADAIYNDIPVSLALQAQTQDSEITLEQADAGYGQYRATAKGKADISHRTFDVSLSGMLPPLEQCLPELHMQGTGQASAQAKGNFDNFHVESQLKLSARDGEAELQALGDVERLTQSFKGEVKGTMSRTGHKFTLDAPLEMKGSELTLSDASLEGEGFSLKAKLHWLLDKSLGDGTLTLDAKDLRPLGAVLGQKIAGRADFKAELAQQEMRETFNIDGRLTGIVWQAASLAKAEFAAHSADLKSLDKVEAHLIAGPIISRNSRIAAIKAQVQGNLNSVILASADLSGTSGGQPFAVKFEGSAMRDKGKPERVQLTARTLSGKYENTVLALDKPVRFTADDGRYELSPFTLKLAGGTVTGKGIFAPQKLAADFAAHRLAMQKLPATLPEGVLDGELRLDGTPAAPAVKLTGTGSLVTGERPLIIHLRSDWAHGKLAVHTDGGMQQSGFTANVDARAPLSFSPWFVGLTDATSIKGNASVNAALESFNAFLRGSGQRMSGRIKVGAQLSGAFGSPKVNGRATLTDGQYDYQDSGICLKGVNAAFTGSGERIALESLKALSPSGNLTGQGSVLLSGARTVSASVNFNRYRLFCGGVASGTVAGNLAASGTLDAAFLRGTLTFPEMNVELPGASHAVSIPKVKTVRVDARGKPKERRALPKPEGASPLTLAVSIHIPEHMFVRGRGLDAEFAGDLNITGPATGPLIAGQFSTRRGRFELLDRQLKLDSAVLRFDGPIPPSPFLDVQAESDVNGTTINVNLSGPATQPVFAFSSTPPLPQDEILAELLFSRSLANLGPFQVAQLAQATAELAGLSSGPGVLGKVRSFLGVDTLDVGTDTNNDVSVGAGKYITSKVYVGVTQGAKPESRGVTTEIELHPHISATTGATTDGQQNVGVQWKYDY